MFARSLLLLMSFCLLSCTSDHSEQELFSRREVFVEHSQAGTYVCTKCQSALFQSTKKLELPDARWPVFSSAVEGAAKIESYSLGQDKGSRLKVRCGKCGLHIGHVCENGEVGKPEGSHICALSSSLRFKPEP